MFSATFFHNYDLLAPEVIAKARMPQRTMYIISDGLVNVETAGEPVGAPKPTGPVSGQRAEMGFLRLVPWISYAPRLPPASKGADAGA